MSNLRFCLFKYGDDSMEIKAWLTAAVFIALTPSIGKAEIRGLYGTNCLEGAGLSAVKDMILREQTMEIVQTVYSDLLCTSPSYDFSFSGPYDLDETTGFLNYGYASIKLQALDGKLVQRFNETLLCGYGDWQLNVPKEVTGLDCGGQLIPARGSRAFDRIRSGPEDESIQLGLISETEDGLSEETRPTEFESLSFYPR